MPRRWTVDPVAVERVCAGTRPDRVRRAEIRAAIDRLDRYRLSAREIAERVGCCRRTVHRCRVRRAAEAVAADA